MIWVAFQYPIIFSHIRRMTASSMMTSQLLFFLGGNVSNQPLHDMVLVISQIYYWNQRFFDVFFGIPPLHCRCLHWFKSHPSSVLSTHPKSVLGGQISPKIKISPWCTHDQKTSTQSPDLLIWPPPRPSDRSFPCKTHLKASKRCAWTAGHKATTGRKVKDLEQLKGWWFCMILRYNCLLSNTWWKSEMGFSWGNTHIRDEGRRIL